MPDGRATSQRATERDIIARTITQQMVARYGQPHMAGWGFYPIADQIIDVLRMQGYTICLNGKPGQERKGDATVPLHD